MDVDRQRAEAILAKNWKFVKKEKLAKAISGGLSKPITELIQSKRSAPYKYVLLAQVLAKATNSELDIHFIQEKSGMGAFDARSFTKEVVVPFNRRNSNVLGTSGDPYVSNPLRVSEISLKHLKNLRDKQGWKNLHRVVNQVEKTDDPGYTKKVLLQILIEIRNRLASIKVAYPKPRRISLPDSLQLIHKYTAVASGGARPMVVACALFRAFGETFDSYDTVDTAKPTEADRPSRRVADIQCYAGEKILLAAEVKDRQITFSDAQDTFDKARENEIFELYFVSPGISDKKKLTSYAKKQFESGFNLYFLRLTTLAKVILSMTGEDGRARFLKAMREVLEEFQFSYEDRKSWADFLSKV